MTPLTLNPIDHWVDLPPLRHRSGLRMELTAAIDTALAIDDHQTFLRGYWIGVTTGYLVGFGLLTREALGRAKATPWAHADADVSRWTRTGRFDENTAWACGVLYGYSQAVSEQPDTVDCTTCSTRLVIDLDGVECCEHGWFCDTGCINDYHAAPLSTCEHNDALAWPA